MTMIMMGYACSSEPKLTCACCGVQETFGEYSKKGGHGTDGRVAAALEKWGNNVFEVPLPEFKDLLMEQLLAPFFVFQVFCVGLWCLDDYMCAPC